MTTYASGAIHFSGLGSDTDFTSMIDKLYEVESMQAQKLLKWKADWNTRYEAFKEFKTELVNLQTSMKKLNTTGKFLTKNTTSSNPAVATFTTTSDAKPGDYTLTVTNIAKSSYSTYQTTAQTKTESISTGLNGKIKITSNNKDMELSVPAGTSLQGLQTMINNHSSNPGVTADLIKTNTGFMLQIKSKETGLATDVTVETTDISSFNNGSAGTWGATPDSAKTAGQDATFSIDGLASNMTSPTNTIKDVIEGVTINLRGNGGGNAANQTTVINVSYDKTEIRKNVESFVEAVNKVRTKLQDLTTVDTNKTTVDSELAESQFEMQKGSVLTGNYGIQIIASKLKSIVSSGGLGFMSYNSTTHTGDVFSSLSQIGIMTDANQGSETYGLLVINDSKSDKNALGTLSLDEAIEKDPEIIAKLFSAEKEGTVNNSSDFGFHSAWSGTDGGNYDVEYTISGGYITGTINGQEAKFDSSTNQFTVTGEGPAKGAAIVIYNLNQGNYKGTLSIKQGKVNEILNALEGKGTIDNPGFLNTEHGTLSILENNYKQVMKNIDTKVLKENTRLETWERRTKQKFARLEATLAKYNGINDSMSQQIKSLGGSS